MGAVSLRIYVLGSPSGARTIAHARALAKIHAGKHADTSAMEKRDLSASPQEPNPKRAKGDVESPASDVDVKDIMKLAAIASREVEQCASAGEENDPNAAIQLSNALREEMERVDAEEQMELERAIDISKADVGARGGSLDEMHPDATSSGQDVQAERQKQWFEEESDATDTIGDVIESDTAVGSITEDAYGVDDGYDTDGTGCGVWSDADLAADDIARLQKDCNRVANASTTGSYNVQPTKRSRRARAGVLNIDAPCGMCAFENSEGVPEAHGRGGRRAGLRRVREAPCRWRGHPVAQAQTEGEGAVWRGDAWFADRWHVCVSANSDTTIAIMQNLRCCQNSRDDQTWARSDKPLGPHPAAHRQACCPEADHR